MPLNRRTAPVPGRVFPKQKMASLRFQTSQENGRKIHSFSRTSWSKIHPNGPDLALEENQDPIPSERSNCVTRFTRTSLKLSCWFPLSDWTPVIFYRLLFNGVQSERGNQQDSLRLACVNLVTHFHFLDFLFHPWPSIQRHSQYSKLEIFKIAQNTTFEAKEGHFITGKVIRRSFSIGPRTYLSIYRYGRSKRWI